MDTNKITPSPWKTIWSKPRETIRRIVDFNPNYRMGLLLSIYGLLALISLGQQYSIGLYYSLFVILAVSVLLAPLWGYITLSLSGLVIYLTGKLLNGEGKFKEIRAVVIWSNVPVLVNLVIWIAIIAMHGLKVFQGFPGSVVLPVTQTYVLLILFTAQVVFSIWALIIVINGIAEVQKFSIIRAIGNLLLSALVFAMISLLIFTAIHWTCSPFFDEPVMVSL